MRRVAASARAFGCGGSMPWIRLATNAVWQPHGRGVAYTLSDPSPLLHPPAAGTAARMQPCSATMTGGRNHAAGAIAAPGSSDGAMRAPVESRHSLFAIRP